MSTDPESILPLSAVAADAAIKDITILHSAAFADAALHDPNGEADAPYKHEEAVDISAILANEVKRHKALNDSVNFAATEFEGSDADNMLKDAFNSTVNLIHARSMKGGKPGEQAYKIRDAIDSYETQLSLMSEAVESGILPENCLDMLTEAWQIATTAGMSSPDKSWTNSISSSKMQGRRP